MSARARNLSIPAILALFIGALASISHAGVVLVYLQGGQSNADGRASTSGLPTSPVNLQQPQADVAYFFHTQGSAHALDSMLTTLRPGMSETSRFGPEITFGRDMADYFSGTPSVSVAVIKYGNGGTNLHTQWKAGGVRRTPTTGDGSEYVTFQNTVTAGLAAISAANPGDTVTIAGMTWMQGESDNNSAANASAYETNLTNFIADVRATYGANLPFVIGEIAVNGGNTNTATIRAAQAAVAAADSLTGFVDVDTFSMQDSLHFSPAGQMSLGSGFALEMQDILIPVPTVLTSVADTYIRASAGTTNYGSNDLMVANNSSTRFTFIRFDISALGTISEAKLELETTIAASGEDYDVLGLLEGDDDWVEGTLTWNTSSNLSGSAIDLADVYGGATIASFTDSGAGVFTVFDVSSGNVIDFLNADTDGLVTFVISELGIVDTSGTGWATKEHASALTPTLTLTAAATGYVNWAADFPGLDLTDPSADYDLDGLPNIIEAWFGTNPGLSNPGLTAGTSDGTTSVFTHPQSLSPPDDVIGSYDWSPNLDDWYGSEDGPVGGPTATIVANTIGSTATVTLTASELIPKLFLRATSTLSP